MSDYVSVSRLTTFRLLVASLALGSTAGAFAEEERTLLLRQPKTLRLSLGPRILRADTAGVAALALVQTALGDWRGAS
jgi:16S rRNA U1498 N3-methylase RsmE